MAALIVLISLSLKLANQLKAFVSLGKQDPPYPIPEFKNLDIMLYKALMRHPIILDGRNCYPLKPFDGTGITYDSIGRETIIG